jgi:hypothetical protein
MPVGLRRKGRLNQPLQEGNAFVEEMRRRTPPPWVLLDESADRAFTLHVDSEVEVVIGPAPGGTGLRKGAVLRRADARFDVLATLDQTLPDQQKRSGLPLQGSRRRATPFLM